MKKLDTSKIRDAVRDAVLDISVHVESSCVEAMKRAEENETNPLASYALKLMNENIALASKTSSPVCQDTGMCIVFAEIGQEVVLTGDILDDAINEGVREGYVYLRKSVLDPVTRINTKDNTPAVIHTSIVKGDKVKLGVILKGFGSENMSKLYMLNPAQGLDTALELIVDTVRKSGSNPCPPVIIGVGLGGTFEKSAILSKHALLRKIGSENDNEELDGLEKELLKRINALGIGAQGFKGNTTCLAVFIEKYPTHISSLPVAVNVCCHAARTKEIILEGEEI